ncbi:hypothetical protein ACNF49_08270 [Actinomadura sp. ATCC 39365]
MEMRQRWLFLVAGLALCALPPAVPSLTTPIAYMARETLIDPPPRPGATGWSRTPSTSPRASR